MRLYRYQTYGIGGCKTWCECFSNNRLSDFETVIHNAVTTVWPGLVAKACLLHLGQSWWWKLQYLGLSKQNGKKESEIRRLTLLKNWTV